MATGFNSIWIFDILISEIIWLVSCLVGLFIDHSQVLVVCWLYRCIFNWQASSFFLILAFLKIIGRLVMILSPKKSFVIHQLSLKAYIRKDYISSFPHKRHAFIKCHSQFLHEISNCNGGTPWNSSKAVNKNLSLFNRLFYEIYSFWEVFHEIDKRHIKNCNHFIFEVLRKARLKPCCNLQYMCNPLEFKFSKFTLAFKRL